MASEWDRVRIGDLGRVVTGKTPSTTHAANFGGRCPFITIPDLGRDRYVVATARTLSEEGASVIRSARLPARAVMMSCIATVGRCGITASESFTNQQINSVICGPKVLPEFLYYAFTLLGHELESVGGGGSVYTNVSKSRFSDIVVTLPPLPEQERIAHILGTLDDKIELNRRMNATLEAMSRAIFKSWFVDFDPVRQKAAGKQPVGMDAQTAALFPDSFEDSEIGEVPKGWQVAPLDEVADYLNGLALQKYPAGDGPTLPVIKIAQLRKGDATGADRCNDGVPAEYVIKDGDVLFSWSGSLEVVIWCGGRGALNQHLFKVTSESYPTWFYYLWTLHHLADFRLIAADKATTMGHIQRKHLSAAKAIVPPAGCIDGMTRTMEPLLLQSIRVSKESRTLAALRDTLLPKLLSGEVRVPEAEGMVEEAVR